MEESMKTAVIWNYCNGHIKYLLWDGDHSNLNGAYVGEAYVNDSLEALQWKRDLLKVSYPEGIELVGEVTQDEFKEAIINGAALVECGELP
jgi:hypothetical protein